MRRGTIARGLTTRQLISPATGLRGGAFDNEAVRTAASLAGDLTAFLDSTYDAAADLARWNRADLKRR